MVRACPTVPGAGLRTRRSSEPDRYDDGAYVEHCRPPCERAYTLAHTAWSYRYTRRRVRATAWAGLVVTSLPPVSNLL